MGAQQGKESNSTSGSLPRHHQHHGMVLQHPADALGGGGGGHVTSNELEMSPLIPKDSVITLDYVSARTLSFLDLELM